jgi:acyl carrier protein
METHETLTDRVQHVLADALRVPREEIGPTTEFGDLPQWDSMGHMEVMVSLEKAFQVEITAETITELVSIPAICAHLEARDGA